MADFYNVQIDIRDVPQGHTLVGAFSTDMTWVGVPKIMNDMFDISIRDDKKHEVGDVAKIDNLYMLFVKESSYDAPRLDALYDCIEKLAKKIQKKKITKLAMPKICCGKNGFTWDSEVLPILEEVFADIDVDVMVCCQ